MKHVKNKEKSKKLYSCNSCKDLGCSLCEDVTLPHHNKEAIKKALNFVTKDAKKH